MYLYMRLIHIRYLVSLHHLPPLEQVHLVVYFLNLQGQYYSFRKGWELNTESYLLG